MMDDPPKRCATDERRSQPFPDRRSIIRAMPSPKPLLVQSLFQTLRHVAVASRQKVSVYVQSYRWPTMAQVALNALHVRTHSKQQTRALVAKLMQSQAGYICHVAERDYGCLKPVQG